MVKTRTQAEHDALIKNTGVIRPMGELRNRFYTKESAVGRFQKDLERDWLRKKITSLGGTPQGKYLSDLWKQLLSASSITPSSSIEENRKKYFISRS